MTKEILRKLMKTKLSLLDDKSFTEMSSLIAKNLTQLMSSLNVIQDKIIIGAFAPIAKEPIWNQVFQGQSIEAAEEIECLTAYPANEMNADRMTFKMARKSDLVIRKDFGFEILGPRIESPEIIPGVILVPGLIFTERGDRLGRGKGFYDKYLNHYHGVKIGICFSVQLEVALPTEKHDVTLDYIVTEKRIINCKHA